MLEQYRAPELARLYQNYLCRGPVEYMAAIFRKLTDSDDTAMQLALEFYGPMYLLLQRMTPRRKRAAFPPCWTRTSTGSLRR